MKFWLKQLVLERTPAVEIGVVEFETYRRARQALVDAFALEEKWDVVVSNYQELEKELLTVAAEHAFRDVHDYEGMFLLTAPLTARVVNLLTATKLYIDHAPQHLEVDALGTLKADFDEERKNRHAASFDYRFMEALRNHVQHRGMPIHMTTYGGSWLDVSEDDRRLEFTTTLRTKRAHLAEDQQFSKGVLREMADSVDLMSCARKYVEDLSHLHKFLRNRLESTVKAARSSIERAHSVYLAQPGASIVGLKAIRRESKTSPVLEEIPLLLNWDDVRMSLEKRNPLLTNLSRRFVTSRPLK